MYEYNARFVTDLGCKVVDGDTVDLMVDLGFKIWVKQRLRLKGVDTPELFGKNKEAGRIAKRFVEAVMSTATRIAVETDKPYSTDKYGRWLGTIHYWGPPKEFGWTVEGTDLNQELIDRGLGKPYDGGKRKK